MQINKLEKPMLVLLCGVLLSHLGSVMVVPMLPIMLKIEAGLTLPQIGIVLAGIPIAFQFGSILGGILADRVGRRLIIGLGAFISASGLIGFSFFNSFSLLFLMAIITGLGNGLNAPSTKAGIAALASAETRTTAFSMRGIAANIGTGAAGLIIFFLVTGSPKVIFWIAGMIYLLLATISWIFLPKKCGDAPCPPIPTNAYREVFKNKPFVVFGLVSILIWALYAQLALALPLRATAILPEPKNVALIWSINSLIVVSVQGIVTKRIINRIHPLSSLAFGILLIGFGMASLFFSSSFIHLVISGAVFVFGEMLILPTMDSTISQLSKAELIGLFFALANVVSGLGEAGGKFFGSNLHNVSASLSYLPWSIYGVMGVILFLIVLRLKKWQPLAASLTSAARKEDRPKQAPRVPISPSQNQSHPFNDWVPELFFRRKPKPHS
jgi:MFS family permease